MYRGFKIKGIESYDKGIYYEEGKRIYSKQKVMNEEDDDEGYSRHKSERKGCIIKAKPSTRCTLSAAGQRQERSFEAYAGERGKAGNSSEVR